MKFQSPFPPIELGYDDKKELCRIAKRVVRETVDSYEKFLWQDLGQLNPSRWFILKASDDVRVYHDKHPKADGASRSVETLLTVGSVVGSLDDAMYGIINHTTDAMRLRAAYMNELAALGNCAVLATVQEPKYDKPFRSMTVKWLAKTLSMPARAVMKPRDLVFVEATGIMRLSSGERAGFHLTHSIDHLPQTRPLPTFTRSTMSVCAIWRQETSDRVQVYVKTFLDIPERLLLSMSLKTTAESLVAVWRNVHCAQMKKLAWLLRREQREAAHPENPTVARCKVCTAKAKDPCLVCGKAVCSKCRVKRELWAISGDGMTEQRAAFCVPCLTVAIKQEAAQVARDEMPEDRDVVKDPSSARSRVGKARPPRPHLDSFLRSSGSSSTSSERTQDTYVYSHGSSKPSLNFSTSDADGA